MEWIDTHTHLYLSEFANDITEVIQRAKNKGVSFFLLPHIDSETTNLFFELLEKFPAECLPMMGLHPCSVKNNYKIELSKCEKFLKNSALKMHGIGEIGLDYYWDKNLIVEQKEALHTQLNWAKEMKLSFSLHSREAIDDAIQICTEEQNGNLKGVFHCFSGNAEQAKKIIDNGFTLGIGGVATFKNGGLEPVLKATSLENIVLETDSPYLAPVPYRGKRNESSYITLVGEKIAAVKEITIEDVARITTENAKRIFQIQ
jgi:TatD DNase family protein